MGSMAQLVAQLGPRQEFVAAVGALVSWGGALWAAVFCRGGLRGHWQPHLPYPKMRLHGIFKTLGPLQRFLQPPPFKHEPPF